MGLFVASISLFSFLQFSSPSLEIFKSCFKFLFCYFYHLCLFSGFSPKNFSNFPILCMSAVIFYWVLGIVTIMLLSGWTLSSISECWGFFLPKGSQFSLDQADRLKADFRLGRDTGGHQPRSSLAHKRSVLSCRIFVENPSSTKFSAPPGQAWVSWPHALTGLNMVLCPERWGERWN